MPEMGEQPLPPYAQRVSTDPAKAYTADPKEEHTLNLWEQANEDPIEYRRLMVEAGYVEIGYYPIPGPPRAESSRQPPPEEQPPVVHP